MIRRPGSRQDDDQRTEPMCLLTDSILKSNENALRTREWRRTPKGRRKKNYRSNREGSVNPRMSVRPFRTGTLDPLLSFMNE